MDFQERLLQIGDLKLNVVDHGEGEPVVLLHGFPDASRVWRFQIESLAEAGFRVLAPDLRGFGKSDCPEGKEHYHLGNVAHDVLGILDAEGIPRANIVGHDFGAATAWLTAIIAPQRCSKLVAMSVGHPGAFFQFDRHQKQLSWYMLYFQFEGVAEAMLPRNDWQLMKDMFAVDHPSEALIEEFEHWKTSLSDPKRLEAALNWYRANLRPIIEPEEPPAWPLLPMPTLGIWSDNDIVLGERQMKESERYISGPWRYERVQGASHHLQLDKPDQISAMLIDFLRDSSAP